MRRRIWLCPSGAGRYRNAGETCAGRLYFMATRATSFRPLVTIAVPVLTSPQAQAQDFPWFGGQPQRRYAPPPRQQPTFNPFGIFQPQAPRYERPIPRNRESRLRVRSPERPVESAKAPAPRKPDGTPTTQVLVLGDSLADWLAYGMEEA